MFESSRFVRHSVEASGQRDAQAGARQPAPCCPRLTVYLYLVLKRRFSRPGEGLLAVLLTPAEPQHGNEAVRGYLWALHDRPDGALVVP